MAKECVILLHGMARSDRSMKTMEAALSAQGYAVVNYAYPSTDYDIETIAKEHIAKAIAQCQPSTKVNFVTHSLGSIILRKYLSEHTMRTLGRAVMLGPPNKGSEVVDKLKSIMGFKLINGPAGMQLGTAVTDVPKSLGPVNFELGVIAGSKSINLLLSAFLPNPDDGKVSVESTKVVGMCGFIVLPTTHAFMMKNKQVITEVIHFLKQGKFESQTASLLSKVKK